MPSDRFSVTVPDDLMTDVEDYSDQHDLSKGKALVRFANRGKQAFGYAGGDSPTTLEEVAGMLYQIGFILGLAFLLLSFVAPLPLLFFIASGSFSVAAVSHVIVWAEPRLTENLYRDGDTDAEATPE